MTSVAKGHKVSIVTVCYNAAKDIEETIKSILGQTYDNIEFIVVDGGSTDGTMDIIRKYDDRISRCVSEPDNGIFDAMNKAAGVASGDYICFMNAGDLFFDENVVCDVFSGRNYEEDVIYGSTIQRYEGGYKSHISSPADRMNVSMPFCHQSSFTRVAALREHPFDISYKHVADCMFFRWLYNHGGKFRQVNRYISIFDMSGYSCNTSLGCYCEMESVACKKATVSGYLKRIINVKFKALRYSPLRFRFSAKKTNGKYFRDIKMIKQLEGNI